MDNKEFKKNIERLSDETINKITASIDNGALKLEPKEQSEKNICVKCGFYGGGHLQDCEIAQELIKKGEKICDECEAVGGHWSYCSKKEKEAEKKEIKPEEEFLFKQSPERIEKEVSFPKIILKEKKVELPQRLEMEFKKLKTKLLKITDPENNKKVIKEMIEQYFEEMKFHYNNDKELREFSFDDDRKMLIDKVVKELPRELIEVLSKLGYGFATDSFLKMETPEERQMKFEDLGKHIADRIKDELKFIEEEKLNREGIESIVEQKLKEQISNYALEDIKLLLKITEKHIKELFNKISLTNFRKIGEINNYIEKLSLSSNLAAMENIRLINDYSKAIKRIEKENYIISALIQLFPGIAGKILEKIVEEYNRRGI